MYFEYGDRETEYLSQRDMVLGAVINKTGHIYRETDADLFSGILHQMAGQQVSTKTHVAVWKRLTETVGTLTPETVSAAPLTLFRECGIPSQRAAYMKNFAASVRDGRFDTAALERLSDDEAVKMLSSQPGIGVWTAEMVLLFSMRRNDVLSFGDFGIRRGLRILFGSGRTDREIYEEKKRLYSPYGSTASLYLWTVAGGDGVVKD